MGKTVFLGVEGSGKTTLAMALLRAFGSHKAEGWYMRPLSRDSFRFVETMPSDFLKEGFPGYVVDATEPCPMTKEEEGQNLWCRPELDKEQEKNMTSKDRRIGGNEKWR